MNESLSEVIKVLSAIKKDSEREKMIELIKNENRKNLETCVTSRRLKSAELIRGIMEIDFALNEFEVHYEFLMMKSNTEEIEAIETYISSIKKYRKKLVSEKKYIK